jgi:hypothetical protein
MLMKKATHSSPAGAILALAINTVLAGIGALLIFIKFGLSNSSAFSALIALAVLIGTLVAAGILTLTARTLVGKIGYGRALSIISWTAMPTTIALAIAGAITLIPYVGAWIGAAALVVGLAITKTTALRAVRETLKTDLLHAIVLCMMTTLLTLALPLIALVLEGLRQSIQTAISAAA